jgi:hypothetical protein
VWPKCLANCELIKGVDVYVVTNLFKVNDDFDAVKIDSSEFGIER